MSKIVFKHLISQISACAQIWPIKCLRTISDFRSMVSLNTLLVSHANLTLKLYCMYLYLLLPLGPNFEKCYGSSAFSRGQGTRAPPGISLLKELKPRAHLWIQTLLPAHPFKMKIFFLMIWPCVSLQAVRRSSYQGNAGETILQLKKLRISHNPLSNINT